MALKAHQRVLLQLLPDGLAWNKAPDTLLADWERFLGLPDCDIGEDAGIDEHQRYVANKLRMKPSLNRQFYIELARSYGFTVSLSTLPDKVGHDCDD